MTYPVETTIREYCEGETVCIKQIPPPKDKFYRYLPESANRLVIKAINEGGNNATEVDLLDVIDWVKKNQPELLKD